MRRVVEDGRSVCVVALELGVSKGSLFFWVRRYREFALGTSVPLRTDADPALAPGTLVAYLRRTGSKDKPPIPAKRSGTSRT